MPIKNNIISIQMLRWLAATLVVVGHAQHEVVKVATRNHGSFHPFEFIDFGIGVDVFFVISGFLMFYVAGEEFGIRGAPWLFLKRRFVRIVPLYWVTTSLMLLAMLLIPTVLNHSKITLLHVLMSYLMIAWPNSNGDVFPLLALGWTLNFEVYFYLVFAITLLFSQRFGLALISLFFITTSVLGTLYPSAGWAVRFYGQPIVIEFAVGQFLAIAYIKGIRLQPMLAVFIGVSALLIHIGIRNTINAPARLIENGIPAVLLFTAWVFSIRSMLEGRVTHFAKNMGDSSYALYLTHPFSLNVGTEILSRLGVRSSVFLIAASTMLALFVGVITFRYIERPLVRGAKEWLLGSS